MIKMTDFYMLCKWENLKNQQCIKYLFSLLHMGLYFIIFLLIMSLYNWLCQRHY